MAILGDKKFILIPNEIENGSELLNEMRSRHPVSTSPFLTNFAYLYPLFAVVIILLGLLTCRSEFTPLMSAGFALYFLITWQEMRHFHYHNNHMKQFAPGFISMGLTITMYFYLGMNAPVN